MKPTDLTVTVDGTVVAMRYFAATGDVLRNTAGRPCAVMAHGFGAGRDCGLADFAEALAAGGVDAVVCESRGFGTSEGDPRQVASLAGQLADHHAAIAAARTLPDVDPDRIVAWGASSAGGHVLQVAAEDGRVAAVVALTPVTTARSAMRMVVRQVGAARAIRTAPQLGGFRPVQYAKRLSCPVLVQVADQDRTASSAAAMATARGAGAEVRHYPCDHSGVCPGAEWHELAGRHQVDFLQRHLATSLSTNGADA